MMATTYADRFRIKLTSWPDYSAWKADVVALAGEADAEIAALQKRIGECEGAGDTMARQLDMLAAAASHSMVPGMVCIPVDSWIAIMRVEKE